MLQLHEHIKEAGIPEIQPGYLHMIHHFCEELAGNQYRQTQIRGSAYSSQGHTRKGVPAHMRIPGTHEDIVTVSHLHMYKLTPRCTAQEK